MPSAAAGATAQSRSASHGATRRRTPSASVAVTAAPASTMIQPSRSTAGTPAAPTARRRSAGRSARASRRGANSSFARLERERRGEPAHQRRPEAHRPRRHVLVEQREAGGREHERQRARRSGRRASCAAAAAASDCAIAQVVIDMLAPTSTGPAVRPSAYTIRRRDIERRARMPQIPLISRSTV